MRYAGMGFELAASIIGLTLAGIWVDYRFHTGPTGVLVGASLGVVGGLYNFIRAALRLSALEKPPDRARDTRESSDRDKEH
jgi:F0F1-type ATP synthase assembly protein I